MSTISLIVDHPQDSEKRLSKTLAVLNDHPGYSNQQLIRLVAEQLQVQPAVANAYIHEVQRQLKEPFLSRAATPPKSKPNKTWTLDEIIQRLNLKAAS